MNPTTRNEPQQRATMADIAAAAGCSLMTVSRALRGHRTVAAATAERVLRAAEALGYRPDPEVSRLMSRLHASRLAEPETIAWLANGNGQHDWRRSPSSCAIFTGAVARAATLGYRMEAFWSGDYGHCGQRFAQVLRHRGIRSILLAPLDSSAVNPFTTFNWQPFVSVACGFSLRQPRLHRVCSQQHQAVSLAWQELWQRGYRGIGLAISRETSHRTANMWLAGFLACQSDLCAGSTPPAEKRTADCRAQQARGKSAMTAQTRALPAPVPPLWVEQASARDFAHWLKAHCVEAVIGTEDVLRLAAQAGMKAPHDFAFALLNVIGAPPDICGVDHHMDALGAVAVELISEQLRLHCYGLPQIPKNLMVECDWHTGSTATGVKDQSACV